MGISNIPVSSPSSFPRPPFGDFEIHAMSQATISNPNAALLSIGLPIEIPSSGQWLIEWEGFMASAATNVGGLQFQITTDASASGLGTLWANDTGLAVLSCRNQVQNALFPAVGKYDMSGALANGAWRMRYVAALNFGTVVDLQFQRVTGGDVLSVSVFASVRARRIGL